MSTLVAINSEMEKTCKEVSGVLSKNDTKDEWLPSDYEERSIRCGKGELNYLIQVFPTIENNWIKGWNFWQIVWTDIGDTRYWREYMSIKDGKKQTVINDISALLRNAIEWLSRIKIEDLEPATKLR
jgi:hypothetical protein